MQDEPKPEELVSAVADFLRNELAPVVSGHAAFRLRVSINALDLVTRQLQSAEASDRAEEARLAMLLDETGPLGDLNRRFAERVKSGAVDLNTPGVAEHLWQTTLEKLAVDPPNYASYRREIEGDERGRPQGSPLGSPLHD